MKKLAAVVMAYTLILAGLPAPVAKAQNRTVFGGTRNAGDYAFGINRSVSALIVDNTAPTLAGTATLTLAFGSTVAGDGTTLSPFATGFLFPIQVGGGSNIETVTPTAVSCTTPGIYDTCTITATFANAHGRGEPVSSATYGLMEALVASYQAGGGQVVVDNLWAALGGTSATITGAVPIPFTDIFDTRGGGQAYWNLQGGSTVMTTPTTLTSSTATDSTTPAGSWANSAYAQGVACVDIMGQEGPVSATYSHTPAAGSSSVTFAAPTNCVGAVGYVIYSTLAGASYPLAYELPLVTQPSVIGATPVSNGACVLTKLETAVPACALSNTTYNQAASNATFTAIALNTSPVAPQSSTISTTSVYVPNPNGRTTYSYVPSSRESLPGITSGSLPYPISAAAGTTVPAVLGSVNIPAGFMNYPGRTIEICGKAGTTASTATIVSIGFQWDAFGQNTAGKGVVLGELSVTPASAFSTTAVYSFCEDFETTVASASATGGSIQTVGGYLNTSGVESAAAGQAAGTDAQLAAVGSLNLANAARINVTYTHTTGTDGTAPKLSSLTVKVIN